MNIAKFKVETKKWKIEFWKGQYGAMHGHSISSGCEIGLYYKKGFQWKCAYQKDRMLRMKMSLYKKGSGKPMFTRDSKSSTKGGKAWWLTAFQPYKYMPGRSSAPAGRLKMTGKIWFGSNAKQYKSGMKELSKKFGREKSATSYSTSWGLFTVKKARGSWQTREFEWSYK